MKQFKKIMGVFFCLLTVTMTAGCNSNDTVTPAPGSYSSNDNGAVSKPNEKKKEQQKMPETEQTDTIMTLTIADKEYQVEVNNNITAAEISAHLPLELAMVKYAGHEYYAKLPFTPAFAAETTSEIKAGHVYYWDGWNAFVINYIDSDIAPYKVVHIGRISDGSIADLLADSAENILVKVSK